MLTPGERDALFVQYVNHAPQARLLADKADVAWGGESSIAAAIEVLEQARRAQRPHRLHRAADRRAARARLSARFANVANLNRAYIRLRQVKSAEELDWLRIGAHFTDLGMAALRDGLKTGHERARTRRPGRARLHLAGRHQRHSLHRRHVDERARSRRAAAVSRPRGACRRATWWSPRSARRSGSIRGRCCAASRWASRRKLYRDLHAAADARLRRDRRRAESRRHAGAGDRGLRRDRGRRLHHHRRSAARLWRRLSAADPRLQEPPGRPGAARSRSAPGRRW